MFRKDLDMKKRGYQKRIGHICIREFTTEMEAQIILGLLSSRNISSVVTADDCGGARGFMTLATGAKLWVREEDLEKTLTVLNESQYKG